MATVPEIRNASGALRKLKRSDFPRTPEGTTAWFDYSKELICLRAERDAQRHQRAVERLEEARSEAALSSDPRRKLQRQIERERKRLQSLEEQLTKLGGE